jgi:1-acyl-sn-glycerol-3-phosphate acyltransferase
VPRRRLLRSRDLSVYHERIRRRGVHPIVYWVTRAVLVPLIRVWFRLEGVGRDHVPGTGPVLVASNHRSFLDPFVLGSLVRRPMYFVAKQELFRNPINGWFLNCLGAFPVCRGASDSEALITSRVLLERGRVVTVFPEGTRVRTGSLREPRRGVGRLALETGAQVVPAAVIGSERARRGWRIRACRVRVRFGRALTFPRVEAPSPRLAEEVTARIWPCVRLQWEWLGGLPPLRRAAVVGAGSMGTALAAVLARAGLEVELGCRTRQQAQELARSRRNDRYLPGVPLPDAVAVSSVADIELAGVDLVVLAVPSEALPQAVAAVGDRVGRRSAVLVVSKGLAGPLGTVPSHYVGERLRTRGVACLAGPAHARETVEGGAAVVLASADADLRDQLAGALSEGGLEVESTGDVVGTELAGIAKNAAAIAASAAIGAGANRAGAVAGRVFSEVCELARREGAGTEAFVGLAGAGDLVGTVMAPASRNRRAGEMLFTGMPADQVNAALDQAAEGLASVPLLAERARRAGIPAPTLDSFAGLIAGDTTAPEWIESIASPQPTTERRAA